MRLNAFLARAGVASFHLHDKIKLIAEFAAKEKLKSSFPLRFDSESQPTHLPLTLTVRRPYH
jgi:hypothetical protein